MTIDVTAVNDLPTATDKTVTATEDTAFVFTVADFGFSDVETGSVAEYCCHHTVFDRHAGIKW